MAKKKKKKEHPLRSLKGASFVGFQPNTVRIDDAVWEPILGHAVHLPGGVELRVDDGTLEQALEDIEHAGDTDNLLLPFIVNDPYYPPVRVLVGRSEIAERYNIGEAGAGPRAKATRRRCTHNESAIPIAGCEFCLWRWWRAKAKAEGVEVTQ